jgi:hypothetical protein
MLIVSLRRLPVIVLAVLLYSSAGAQSLFRCGNVYQDRPCEAGTAQKELTPSGRPTPATQSGSVAAAVSSSPYAAVCSRVGEQAQKITWKREAGATQERQMAELPNTGSREEMARVIDSVYRKRGSAPEIRAAIEAECIAERQEAADAAAALRLLQSQQNRTASTPAAVPVPATTAPTTTAAIPAAPQTPGGPSPSCDSFRRQLESVNAQLRSGGTVAVMEQLQNRRRDAEKQLREGRC